MRQFVSNTRSQLSKLLMQPAHSYNENYLGFELDFFSAEGWPAQDIEMHETRNTRLIDQDIEQMIAHRWAEIVAANNAFESPRARYEGCIQDSDTGKLHVFWSEDNYKNHSVLRELRLPRQYQANLYTINGIPYTSDRKIPLVVRNPNATDQGRIRHIVPAGFCDIISTNTHLEAEGVDQAAVRNLLQKLRYSGIRPEDPYEATGRELEEELSYNNQGSFPPEVFDISNMLLLGVVYNSRKNFDYAASVFIPLNADSGEIVLNGNENSVIEWIDTDYQDLSRLLYELALSPETNSGHLRGDITLLISHLYGEEACKQAVEKTLLDVAKYNLRNG